MAHKIATLSGLFFVLSCSAASGPGTTVNAVTQNTKAAASAKVSASATASSTAQLYSSEAIARGMKIYRVSCIACHNLDPRKPGSQGPEIYGASAELLEARVLHKKYPPGYKPKRTTNNMTMMPQLKKELPALEAYLNSPL